MEQRLTGVYTALATPFRADGRIDEPSLRKLVDRQLEAGVAGLVPCGTTGESAAMTTDEWERTLAVVVEQTAGRVPVIAGAGSNQTAKAVDLSRRCARIGVNVLLQVTPYYVKPTQQGMIDHYRAIADATDLPILLYNVPGRTGVTLAPETVLRLAESPSFVGIKQAVADLDQASAILRSRPRYFAVLSGEDSLALPMIALGGDGVISVISNQVPRSFAALVQAALAGRREEAAALHAKLFPLMRANFIESNPIPVKFTLAELGLIENVLRTPLTPLSEACRETVRAALRQACTAETACPARNASAPDASGQPLCAGA
jgi:4-hydroxy-tetrahydrodipicolinate synthase